MIGNLTDEEVAGLRAVLTTLGGPGNKTIDGTLRVTGGLGVFGKAPPTARPEVDTARGGTVVDVQARAVITNLVNALVGAGLIQYPPI